MMVPPRNDLASAMVWGEFESEGSVIEMGVALSARVMMFSIG